MVEGRSRSGFVLVAVAASLWGTDALFRRGLALDMPSSTVVAYEHLILTAFMLPTLLRGIGRLRYLDRRDWIAITVVGAGASALATLLFTAAFRYGDPTTPLLLQKLQPLIAVGGAALLLRERLLPRYGVYVALAISGAVLVSIPDPMNPSVSSLTPALLAVGAATLWGLGTVLGRHLTAKIGVPMLTALRFSFGLPAAVIFVLLDAGPAGFTVLTVVDLPALLLLSAIPGLAALLLYYRGLRSTPASLATVAELAFPVAAVSINYVAFGTTLRTSQWFGAFVLVSTITAMGVLSHTRGSHSVGVHVRGRTIQAPH